MPISTDWMPLRFVSPPAPRLPPDLAPACFASIARPFSC
jgi:hypothetical protein